MDIVRMPVVGVLQGGVHLGMALGVNAVAIVLLCSLALGGSPPLALLLSAFCLTAPSYAIDRFVDRARDAVSQPCRATRFARQRHLLLLFSLMFGVSILAGPVAGRPLAGLFVLVFPGLVALYTLPWLTPFWGLQRIRRIKDIPFAKAFYTSLCWGLLAPLAALYRAEVSWSKTALLTLLLAFWCFPGVVASDLKDVDEDRRHHVITFATELGVARTLTFIQVLNGLALLTMLLAVAAGLIGRFLLLVGLQPLLFAVATEAIRRHPAQLRYFSEVIADVIYLLWLPLIGIGYVCLGA